MTLPIPSTRLAICAVTAVLMTGAAGLVAFAGPQLTAAAEPAASDTPYTVTCWQEGREVVTETSAAGLSAIDIASAESVGLAATDGSRRTLVALGEALCLIDVESR
ncbi:MAG: hypothetical protein AAF253_07085 [Pseudomonadota bacterium]